MAEDELFYVGQKAFIEKDGKILLLNDPIGGLDTPGGKIQMGERDFAKSLQREIMEETNFEITVGDPFYVDYYNFSEKSGHRNKGKLIFIVFYKCRYRSGELKLSDEHDKYYWIDKTNYLEYKGDTTTYRALEKYFSSLSK